MRKRQHPLLAASNLSLLHSSAETRFFALFEEVQVIVIPFCEAFKHTPAIISESESAVWSFTWYTFTSLVLLQFNSTST